MSRPEPEQAAGPGPVAPGPPSSVALFLSGLGSLGMWQVGRSAKRLHFGHLPHWFHDGAPSRIGHTVLFDLSDPQGLQAAPDQGATEGDGDGLDLGQLGHGSVLGGAAQRPRARRMRS